MSVAPLFVSIEEEREIKNNLSSVLHVIELQSLRVGL